MIIGLYNQKGDCCCQGGCSATLSHCRDVIQLAFETNLWPFAYFVAVRRAARRCGLKEVGEDEEWTVYWTDCSVSLERVMEMKRFQVLAVEVGMRELWLGDVLAYKRG